MSLDQRLREGLRAEAGTVEPSPGQAYAGVLARHASRRRTRRRVRTGAAVLAAAAVTVVVLLSQGPSGSDRDAPITPQPPTPVAPSSVAPTLVPGSDARPPEGTWEATLTGARIAAELRRNGLGASIGDVLGDATEASSFAYTLKLEGGVLTMTTSVDGVSRGVQDSQLAHITGDRVVVTPHGADCNAALGWRVRGDVLTLDLRRDSCPDYQGRPDEAYLRSLYTSTSFTRLAP